LTQARSTTSALYLRRASGGRATERDSSPRVGHTDSQGSAPYNLDLSQRRAAAVYLWLIQHGIDSGRLRSDGRGLMEPIADNETETGRALNRRVEVKALN
jgi:outer membrane protein OmpA-like peptidoglycan-associated protein